MSRRSREKDRGCGTEETVATEEGREGRGGGGGERGATDGKVEWQREPSGAGLRPLILPVCSCTCDLCVYTSLSAKSFCRACASERTPQLIKPPRNLYRHYTCCFACKNHLRHSTDRPPVLASQRQQQRTTVGFAWPENVVDTTIGSE